MTSRTPILDQCLAIRNLLALNDHELEQVINLKQEKEEAQDDIKASYDKDIFKTKEQYYSHYLLRKELQKTLFDQYDIDLSYWCQFKHRLTVHEALKEIADATNNPSDRELFEAFTQDLYTWIGEITGLGHTPCGRCLLDATLSSNNNTNE